MVAMVSQGNLIGSESKVTMAAMAFFMRIAFAISLFLKTDCEEL